MQTQIKLNREAELKAKEVELKRKASEMEKLCSNNSNTVVVGDEVIDVNSAMDVVNDEDDADLKEALALSVQPTVFDATTSSSTTNASVFGNSHIPNTGFTGFYELFGIVTHKGRSADSGHYIAWVRSSKDPEVWLKFDDDVVTEVTYAEIQGLKGSADWHTAYLNFYRVKLN